MAFVNLPPNFQDIFSAITDRIAKLETGPNQAMYVAESAQGSAQGAYAIAVSAQTTAINADATANTANTNANAAATAAANAQTSANTALANAATAYAAAIASLQPSASTIVNASNQMTAINTSGITVYSGASSSSGARVVMNSLGLAGYNSGGTATFSILASTGAATFSGTVTGASIVASTLNIGGNFYVDGSTGVLQCTGATITGTVNATAGYFGSSSNGWSISSTGLVGVGTGYISTSSGSSSISLDSQYNAIRFKNGGSYVGSILPWSSNGIYLSYGSTPSTSNYPATYVGSATAVLAGSSTVDISSTPTGNAYNGTFTGYGDFNITSSYELRNPYSYNNTTTNAATVWVSSTGQYRRYSPSSERYKTDIVDLINVPELNPNLLYELPVRAFRYKEGIIPATDDRYDVLIPGFIAEEVDTIYPQAADYEKGDVETWNHRTLIPGMLALIQEQNNRIKILEGK